MVLFDSMHVISNQTSFHGSSRGCCSAAVAGFSRRRNLSFEGHDLQSCLHSLYHSGCCLCCLRSLMMAKMMRNINSKPSIVETIDMMAVRLVMVDT